MNTLLRDVHVMLAVVTITGFALRAYWMMMSSPLLSTRATRIAPHIVDTLFLLSGIVLLAALSVNPLRESWLLAKFIGLIAYIVLGAMALRRGKTKNVRMLAFLGAVSCFAYIVGVALTRSVTSWLAYIRF